MDDCIIRQAAIEELRRMMIALYRYDAEIYEFISWLLLRYAKQFTDSRQAIIDWPKGDGA